MTTQPTTIRFEHAAQGFGLGNATPRLSWTVVADPGWTQAAYEVVLTVDGTEVSTGRVNSADSVLVAWPFDPLRSRQRGDVRVRVWNAGVHEPTAWSASSPVEVGLLRPSDWSARAVASTLGGEVESTVRFRRQFEIDGEVASARLYVSALGVFTAEVNGVAIGDEVLAPGWTVYTERIRYHIYDVTTAVRAGSNMVGMTVAEGWYRGRLGFHGGIRDIYGDRTAAIAQLEVTRTDGSVELIATDHTWHCGPSPIVTASLYDGEVYDARLVDDAWSVPGGTADGWRPVDVLDIDVSSRLEAPIGPPVLRHEVLVPVLIWTSPTGRTLVDFGQNISGRLRITVAGQRGTEITLRHAEVLEHGELGTRPLRFAAATDRYVLSGDGVEVYEPTFTIHGFRYAEVDGWPGELTADSISAIACYSAIGDDGDFECSHEGLNQLHRNVRWSMKGNFVDIPTDCPQRDERLGWTGDIQVFGPTAAFLADCSGFLSSWLKDLAIEQQRHGTVPPYVPWVQLIFPPFGTAAWSDAAVIVPWTLYEHYGDVGVLADQYDSMKSWVDTTTRMSSPSGLWDEGFQFGDWLDPAAPPENPAAARTQASLVATAHRYHSANLLSETAAVLGRTDDAVTYRELAEHVRAAFNHEFVSPSGRLSSDAQTAYALALGFGLITTDAQRARAGQRLRELVAADGYCIGTGFVGTPLVCDALADAGNIDDAYWLLTQTACPSWLYPVSMGATTIWERWDSMLPDGSINLGEMTSFNHYALGAVASFMHRRIAGLAPGAPGYRRLHIEPLPGGGLSYAKARHRTPYGEASVAWERVGSTLQVDVVVPPSCTATVVLPGRTPTDVGSGRHHFEVPFQPVTDDQVTPPPTRHLFGAEPSTTEEH